MSNKNEPDIFEQMSIFQIMNLLDDPENTFSSEDISKIIDKLSGVKRKKESIEAKKRQQEERERREREAREAKERKEAHIREVTSIRLLHRIGDLTTVRFSCLISMARRIWWKISCL